MKWITRERIPFNPPLVFMPLHKGADSFMNDEQFRKFYWPSLRKVIVGLIADGFVPYLFAEGALQRALGGHRRRARGRTVWHFDRTDMRQGQRGPRVASPASRATSRTRCSSWAASKRCTTYCRDLIEAVGSGGGFILDVGATVDDAKDENMHGDGRLRADLKGPSALQRYLERWKEAWL